MEDFIFEETPGSIDAEEKESLVARGFSPEFLAELTPERLGGAVLQRAKWLGERVTTKWYRSDHSSWRRKQMLDELAKLGPYAAYATVGVIEALDDPDREVRRAAARVVSVIGPPAKLALPRLIELLKDENSDIQYAAVRAITNFGSYSGPAILGLIELLKNKDTEHYVLEMLRICFVNIGPKALPALVELLDHPDVEVVIQALYAIREYRQEAAYLLPRFKKILAEREDLWSHLCWVIGSLGPDAIPYLADFIKVAGGDKECREGLTYAIGELGVANSQTLAYLQETLSSLDYRLMGRAVEALVKLGEPAKGALIDTLNYRLYGAEANWIIAALQSMSLTLDDIKALIDVSFKQRITYNYNDDNEKFLTILQKGGKAAVPLFIDVLTKEGDGKHGDSDTLNTIFDALVSIADQDDVMLRTMLTLSDYWTLRIKADEYILERTDKEHVVDFLIAAARDRKNEQRQHAVHYLTRLGIYPKTILPVLLELTKDTDPAIRKIVYKGLAVYKEEPQARLALKEALNDEAPSARVFAIWAAGELGMESRYFVPLLRSISLADEDPSCRKTAADVLSKYLEGIL